MEFRIFGDNSVSLEISVSNVSSIKHFQIGTILNIDDNYRRKFESGQYLNVLHHEHQAVCLPNLSTAKVVALQKNPPTSYAFPDLESYRTYWKKRVSLLKVELCC